MPIINSNIASSSASSPRRRGPKNIDALKKSDPPSLGRKTQAGFSLIEMIVFIVVISIALGALLAVYQQSVISSVDPIKRIRMLELAQAQLDRVMAQRYAEETPMGGIPACDSPAGVPCTNSIDGLDDVDDYHNFPDTSGGYNRTVTVESGLYFGSAAKQVSVTVTAPDGESLTLTSYRFNF